MSKQDVPFRHLQILLMTLAIAFAVPAFSLAQPESLRPVDPLPMPSQPLVDQFDQASSLPSEDFQILFCSDMESYQLLRENLPADTDGEKLNHKKIILVADISAMPSLIAKMFALPKMRKLKYPIRLDREGEITKGWPREKSRVTVLTVQKGKITAARILATAADLVAFWGKSDGN